MNEANRFATPEELEEAERALSSMPDKSDLVATIVKFYRAGGEKPEDVDGWPLVVRNFAEVDDETQVILVPAGAYRVSAEFFMNPRCIIGLPGARPTLMLEGEVEEVSNYDTLEETPLRVCETTSCKFVNLRLGAQEHTVLKIFTLDGGFASHLMRVEYSENVDVLDIGRETFRIGRDWALAAYGSIYGTRGVGEKVVDSVFENAIGTADAVFRPLVALGRKLDNLLA
jgi:hypothetical protein